MLTTTYLLIGINVLVSLIAFSRMKSETGSSTFLFSPSEVSAGRNYRGMLLSHFSHADGTHLLFNMITLYSFGPVVEEGLGTLSMLLIYVSAGILSTLVVYYRHRGDPKYRSLGASDSITGILFAGIVVYPAMSLVFFIITYPIPAPLFAVGYIVLSTYFMRRGKGHISHEAHLAGAFVGLVLGGLLAPEGFSRLLQELQSYLT
jgi:membrane associated rhomboid family serine protease